MNEIAVVYCFDNKKQYDMFLTSVQEIKNQSNIDIVLIIKKDCIDREIINDLKENLADKIKVFELENKSYNGMFYWLLAPLLTEYKYYVQLDNDTLINKINIVEFIKKYAKKLEKKAFLGVKSFGWMQSVNKKAIKYFRNNYFDYIFKTMNYINTGVVLINGERVRNKLSQKGYSESNIEYFIDVANKEKFRKTDQEYLHIFFWKELGYIQGKYNVRMHILYDINKTKREKKYIAHYNIYSTFDLKWYKYDFIGNLKNKDIEEFSEEISEFWASSDNRNYRKKNRYKKTIKVYYANLKKLFK